MNYAIAHGRWQQLKGAVAAHWGRLTGDRLSVISGRHWQRVGELEVSMRSAQAQIGREVEAIIQRSLRVGRGA